ncbi:DUF1127 domain-containing protein [Yoonia sp. 208BN28-4]|uniref:DUF1127 domain-containing protein n=1 Tax=Yoonia sp. 208BN28-4 TaxID=3126505 RepID=UPI0030B3EC80
MAAFDTARPLAASSAPSFVSVFANSFGMLAAWNDARITRKSLGKLSARELEDIGLTSADIDAVATGTYRF